MIQAYSENVEVTAQSPVAFNNTAIKKGCTAEMSGTNTINLNKRGVYMVEVDSVAGTATTLQLYKDGVAMPQAQSTGTNPSFSTLVQVDKDNSNCCCSSPTTLQVVSSAGVTLTNANIVVTKLC